jgi:hypothetical protein
MTEDAIEADNLFKRLDAELKAKVNSKFFVEPKNYKSLVDVVEIVNTSNSTYICINL